MTLAPFPDGWYCLSRSDELSPGQVLNRRLAGEDVVLFRARSGSASAFPPHCPHLGAHLGHGGVVDGETLRCPMHGFCFDASGQCVQTAYAGRVPPNARLTPRPLVERHGFVFVWHATDGRAPAWELPERELSGASSLRSRTWNLRGHPQETTENGVDIGHLGLLHGFRDVELTAPVRTEGPYLTAAFAVSRQVGPGSLGRLGRFRSYYTVHLRGLGYSLVEVEVPALGSRTQQYVFATPTDSGRLAFTIGLHVLRAPRLPPALGRLHGSALSRVIMAFYQSEVRSDLAIWEHKRYLEAPALAEGDGPIGRYRSWARQFYSGANEAAAPAFDYAVPTLKV